MRFFVLEAGDLIGYTELPEPDRDDGVAFGDLTTLPGYERCRTVLETAARANFLMWQRVLVHCHSESDT